MDEKRQADFDWQAALMPEVKRACGPYIMFEAPPEEDMKHNTDLMTVSGRFSVRIREYEYLHQRNYSNEFTIRSSRQSGAQTELAKVISGWGDYIFYGFATPDKQGLAAWVLGDLKVFRRWFTFRICEMGGKLPGISCKNADGSSEFRAFTIDELPPDFVIARVTADMQQIAANTLGISQSAETATDVERWEEYSNWVKES